MSSKDFFALVILNFILISTLGCQTSNDIKTGDETLIGFSGATSTLLERDRREEVSIQIKELGGKIEHQFGSWSEIETDKDTYDWKTIDTWYKKTG